MEKKKLGRSSKVTPEKVEEMIALRNAGFNRKEIAEITGIGYWVVVKRFPEKPQEKKRPVFKVDMEKGIYNPNDWYKVAGHTI